MRIPLGLRAAAGATQGGWDITSATFNGSPINFYYGGNNGGSGNYQAVHFKPDGTKMYVAGDVNNRILEYNLSTAWDISTVSYVQFFSATGQETTPNGVVFKSDGTKMYIIGANSDSVHEYDLSTAWDVSTASYSQNFSVSTEETQPEGLFFKPDGTKMYIIGVISDSVHEYDLSTAWDISTASYLQSFSVSAQANAAGDVFFKDDGTKMYVIDPAGYDVNEYDLSTAWDISTASFLQSKLVNAFNEDTPTGLYIKGDGTKVYVVGSDRELITEWDFSTAWDISTITFTPPSSNIYSTDPEVSRINGMAFKPDGTKMYLVDATPDDISEYNLSTAWDISTASYVQAFDVTAEEDNPAGLAFKPDGTKMYVTGTNGDNVNEYNLSTAWDVSTASYSQSFSVATEEGAPNGLTFKPDGTKMYVIGIIGDDVNEYDLSTAWDVSTASYVQNFGVQDTQPRDVHFKPDGTKMYTTGSTDNRIYEYDLSTAWDISTASYLQFFDASRYGTFPAALFFKPNGRKLYIADFYSQNVWSFDL